MLTLQCMPLKVFYCLQLKELDYNNGISGVLLMHRPDANLSTALVAFDQLAKQQCLFQRVLDKLEFINNGELQR